MKTKLTALKAIAFGSLILPAAVPAALIVNLNPATAQYDGGPVNDRNNATPPGTSSCLPAANPTNGLTFNLEFIPMAADLTGTVVLMELGHNASGTGLLLVDGVPTLVCKMGSAAANKPEYYPAGLPDLDFANQPADTNNVNAITNANSFGVIAAQSSFGVLQAGQPYSMAVSFSYLSNKFELGVESCGTVTTNIFITTNSAWTISGPPAQWETYGVNFSWPGNSSLTVGPFSQRASLPLSNEADPAVWAQASAKNFAGAIIRGIYWNDAGVITGPQAPVAIPVKAASASQICGFSPTNTVDNDANTIWITRSSSTTATNEWLQLDLGAVLPVDGVILTPTPTFVGFPVDYRIEHSADQINWFTAPGASFTGVPAPSAPVTNLFSSTVQARYVRMFATLTSGTFNYQLAEFQAVLGTRIAGTTPGLDIAMESGFPTLSLTGTVGAAYQVEYVSLLPTPGCWTLLTNAQLNASPLVLQDSGVTNKNQRYYRAVGLPAYP